MQGPPPRGLLGAWPRRLALKVVETRGDGHVLERMVRCDFLCPFAGALGDFH